MGSRNSSTFERLHRSSEGRIVPGHHVQEFMQRLRRCMVRNRKNPRAGAMLRAGPTPL
eukprot:SAG31_NODE_910_length_11078_cov_25.691062_7_plen_58_part_00